MKKDLLSLLDLEKEDIDRLLNRAIQLKERHKNNIPDKPLSGKTLGLIFDKPSTRTRISFEAAMVQLGGTPLFINAKDTQIVRNEPIKDVARVVSRYLDAVAIRTYAQSLVEEFAFYASIPVINALTDLYHPCQVLSDLMTIIEHKGSYEALKIVWIGDGNNVCHSWIHASAVLGLNLVVTCPDTYQPDSMIFMQSLERRYGRIIVSSDPKEAIKDADVVYTDVWASMGQEESLELKKQIFKPFQINSELIQEASKEVIVMHCLPAHRGEEITDDVLEGPRSVVWDQAENKLHIHKAILEALILK